MRHNPVGACGINSGMNFGGFAQGSKAPAGALPFYREFYYMAQTISLTASSGAGTVGTYSNTVMRVDSDADFEVQKIIFQATSPSIKLRIRSSNGEYISPENIDLQTIGGTAFNSVGPGSNVAWFTPYIMSWPFRFSAATDIIIEAADYSGSANTLYMCLLGAQIHCGQAPWNNQRYVKGQPVFRSTDRQTVSANGSKILTVNLDNDADVLITKAQAARTGAALITANEGARGRDWGNASTHIDNLFGSGQFAHKLSAPRFVPRGSSITFNVQDTSGSSNVVELVLEGIKYHDNGR